MLSEARLAPVNAESALINEQTIYKNCAVDLKYWPPSFKLHCSCGEVESERGRGGAGRGGGKRWLGPQAHSQPHTGAAVSPGGVLRVQHRVTAPTGSRRERQRGAPHARGSSHPRTTLPSGPQSRTLGISCAVNSSMVVWRAQRGGRKTVSAAHS